MHPFVSPLFGRAGGIAFVGGEAQDGIFINYRPFPAATEPGDLGIYICDRQPRSANTGWASVGSLRNNTSIYSRRLTAADIATGVGLGGGANTSFILAVYRGVGETVNQRTASDVALGSSGPVSFSGFAKAAGSRALLAVSASMDEGSTHPSGSGAVSAPPIFTGRFSLFRGDAGVSLSDCLRQIDYVDGASFTETPPTFGGSYGFVFEVS